MSDVKNVKCGISDIRLHDMISPSRAPIKKAILQQCVDCGLTFEGLDQLRDHLKVAQYPFPEKLINNN